MYDPKTGLHRKENSLTVPNGISWSKDNTSMFFADSATWCLFKYDFDAETGAISNKRVFWKAVEGTGPDGHVRDQNDNIWTAVWGAWKVVCLSPAGEVIAEIALPTRCVTVCYMISLENRHFVAVEK
jgi:sugar lactone lactonase YvrE